MPHETAAVSVQVLCKPYSHAPCHFMQLSHLRKMYACLAVTCHLHFWQNDRDILRATAVTWGWNGYQKKSAQKLDPGEEKCRPWRRKTLTRSDKVMLTGEGRSLDPCSPWLCPDDWAFHGGSARGHNTHCGQSVRPSARPQLDHHAPRHCPPAHRRHRLSAGLVPAQTDSLDSRRPVVTRPKGQREIRCTDCLW